MPADNFAYLEVAVAAPISQTLTYKRPDIEAALAVGQRLMVPLGRRLVTGYLLSFSEKPEAGYRIKKVASVLDTVPLFPENMVPFFRWVARYYQYPIGEVIRGALPGGLTSQSGRELKLTDEGRESLAAMDCKEPWLADLLSRGRLSAAAMRRLWKGKAKRQIEQWAAEGLVELCETVSGQTVRQKTETCVVLHEQPNKYPDLKPSEEKTLTLVRETQNLATQPVARRDLARAYPGARQALKGLAAKGLIELVERNVYRDPFGEPPQFFPKPAQLTVDQQTVLGAITPAIAAQKYAPFLLHGVTGSGKTEVYLRASEETLAQGRGILVLVPEIALATQLEGHFFSRFGDQVALLHSGLSQGERFDQWQRVVRGEARIVIGARSAIFAPLKKPGLIIVDEEHDGAYKQEDGLRYQGRDLAVLRGSQAGAVVILGSATPSITSFQHARSGKFTLLTMPNRIENRPLPQVEIIDLQGVNTVSGRPPLFSPQMTRALRETLAAGQQSLVFLNRRGFASCMLCGDCGQPVECSHCHVTLTLHKGKGELVCHYCGYSTRSATVCTSCRSPNLIAIGFGTERIEEELHTLFPAARIARLDRDTTVKRTDFIKILKAVHQREIDILVGTQMITKGHHFPHVTLVGIVWADAGLGIPDYKSGERTFQLLSQVTGRAGRGEHPGRVIVQTLQPQHYAVQAAQLHDYETLFAKEIELRKALGFPPFSRLINLRLDGEDEAKVQERAILLAARAQAFARNLPKTDIMGPAPSPLAMLRNRFRWQLLLRGSDMDQLHNLCHKLNQEQAGLGSAVNLSVDVDPENML